MAPQNTVKFWWVRKVGVRRGSAELHLGGSRGNGLVWDGIWTLTSPLALSAPSKGSGEGEEWRIYKCATPPGFRSLARHLGWLARLRRGDQLAWSARHELPGRAEILVQLHHCCLVPLLTLGEFCEQWRMLKLLTALFVFLGGFAVMVLEIIGAPFLQKDFGSEYFIWVNQIGVILTALAFGYSLGGAVSDRLRRVGYLAPPLALVGFYVYFIPQLSQPLLDKLINRHPAGAEIPMLWVRMDPILGSALVFFLPCFVLAVISPYMVRFAARRLEQVGTVSGMIYASSTAGSIAGVFVTGYVFLAIWGLGAIFKMTGILVIFLAGMSLLIDVLYRENQRKENPASPNEAPER